MSVRQSVRAFPALLRIGLLETVAYRGEMVVWVLTTTMPLIMLALFGAVVRDAPIGRMGERQMTAYFLATFVVRQLTSSWVSWQINMEVRDGTLSSRLLRPVHPLIAYAAEGLATTPFRAIVSVPMALVLLFTTARAELATDGATWALWVVSIVGAWLLSLFVSLTIGVCAFFLESSTKVMDVWLAAFFVFSGYLVPIEVFPPALQIAVDWLPFRYQLGLPVEIMTGAHTPAAALALIGRQWMFVVLAGAVALFAWRRGVGRFSAFGG